jgi:hypothetical protein
VSTDHWENATNGRSGFPTPLRVVTDTEAATAANERFLIEALAMAERFAEWDRLGHKTMSVGAGRALIDAWKELPDHE